MAASNVSASLTRGLISGSRWCALPAAVLLVLACSSSGLSHNDPIGDSQAAPLIGTHGQPVVPPSRGLPAETRDRRAALAAAMGEGVVWLEAAPENNLGRFFQEDDFYYLSGVEIPEIALAIRVADGTVAEEVLFLPPHDPMFEVWNGARLAPGIEAQTVTGFGTTAPVDERQAWLDALPEGTTVHTHAGDLVVDFPVHLTRDTTKLLGNRDHPGWLSSLRLVKSAYEIQCLRNAINITCDSFHEALRQVQPGHWEYQVQAAMEGGFMHRGSERPGFSTICGSGPNSVTLHYNANREPLDSGELIVVDVGAKYRYYTADVTRTFPVNGKFTERQLEIYNLVLAAQTAAAEAARPGMTMRQLDAIARGIISEAGYGKYFKHGLGHWIGLNVHDVGGSVPIEVDTLFTIEPGIYITEEALGVRIEDDYIMTPTGAEKISTGIPSDPGEIEELMQKRR